MTEEKQTDAKQLLRFLKHHRIIRRHEEGNKNRPDLADHRCDCGRILRPLFSKIWGRNHSRFSALQQCQAERNAIAFIRRWNVKLNLGKSHATSTRVTRFGRLNVVRLTLR